MFIFTRRVGEVLTIGNETTLRVIDVNGDQVRIGVNAPDEVTVHEEETLQSQVCDVSPGDQ